MKKKKYSKKELRSYWVGYGIALAENKNDKSFVSPSIRFLTTGPDKKTKSALAGHKAGRKFNLDSHRKLFY